MKVFCNTDKGLLRSNNQDAYANGMFDDGTVWAVVCDGMGGLPQQYERKFGEEPA